MIAPPRLARRLVPALVLAVMSAAPPCAAEDEQDREVRWRGPVRLRSQFALDQPTLDLTPDAAYLLAPGSVTLELTVAHSNTFEITPAYDDRVKAADAGDFGADWDFNVDGELTRASLRLDWGVSRRVQLGLEIPFVAHSEGFLDSLISDVHDALGVPDNDRDLKPEDVFNIDLLSSDGRLTLRDEESGLGDVVVRGKVGLFTGERAAVSLVGEVKLPTGEEEALAGSGEVDWGLTLLVSAGGARHAFHGGVGHFVLGQPDAYPVDIEDRTSLFGAYEYRPGDRWSLVVQALAATSLLPEAPLRTNDDPRVELAVGAHVGGEGWQLTFGFVENVTTNDNTADLGLFVAGRWWLR